MIKIFNTLIRKKEAFKPIRPGRVGLYTCGPTVYNLVHIGNLRTFVFQDVLKKVLRHSGYAVKQVMNTTDVDDKTIRAAKDAGKSLQRFTAYYEKIFLEDLKDLNIQSPTVLARATEHIPEMVRLIEKLLQRGFAYRKEGSVYFSVEKFKPYGRLARLDKKGLKPGVRVDADEYAKNEIRDFVLWKGRKESEPYWKAPFGEGRPGWHIECSAMSMKYLGESFDIHSAGVDLVFPHHENEIAQSEAATGKKFAHYWVHGEHLLVDGKKMSKSLENIFTLRDLKAKGFNPLAFRYLVLTAHYRSKLNFSWGSLAAAQVSLEKLHEFIRLLKKTPAKGKGVGLYRHRAEFFKALQDDLNTPRALALLWKVANEYHRRPERFDARALYRLFLEFDTVLGLGVKEIKNEAVPTWISALARKREEFRNRKQWNEADKIREEIRRRGWIIEDAAGGPRLKKA